MMTALIPIGGYSAVYLFKLSRFIFFVGPSFSTIYYDNCKHFQYFSSCQIHCRFCAKQLRLPHFPLRLPRPSSMFFSLGIVRDIVPPIIHSCGCVWIKNICRSFHSLKYSKRRGALNPTVYIALIQTPLLSHTCHEIPHPPLTPPKLVARE